MTPRHVPPSRKTRTTSISLSILSRSPPWIPQLFLACRDSLRAKSARSELPVPVKDVERRNTDAMSRFRAPIVRVLSLLISPSFKLTN